MIKNNYAFVSDGLPALLPKLWRFADTLSHSPDIAEDLVQAACVRALVSAEQFQQGTNFDRWVFTILSFPVVLKSFGHAQSRRLRV
jgi:RNA polymerase sigma-70 factor (ECF subfamily)